MTKVAKIAIGCLVALLLVCLISAVVLFFAGSWLKEKVGSLFGGAMDTGKSIQAIQKLDELYPFDEPPGGAVDEARLQAYIAVCAKAKPAVERYQGFMEKKSGQHEGSFKDVKDALAYTKELTEAMREGLEEQKMSPREFTFVADAMREASIAVSSGGGEDPGSRRESIEGMIQTYENQLQGTDLPGEARAEMEAEVSRLKEELAGMGAPSDPNAALYLRYKEQLEAVDLQGFEGMAFTGSSGAS